MDNCLNKSIDPNNIEKMAAYAKKHIALAQAVILYKTPTCRGSAAIYVGTVVVDSIILNLSIFCDWHCQSHFVQGSLINVA